MKYSAENSVAPSVAALDSPAEGRARNRRRSRNRALLAQAWRAQGAERRRIQDEVVRLNLDVARDVARRYQGRGISLDDLFQVASLALCKAVRGFDPSRGTDILSYAVPTMRGELRKTFRDHGWMVRPPRSMQELQAECWRAEAELIQELGRSPRPSEIAEHLGVELDRVREALAIDGCFAPSSIDASPVEDDQSSLVAKLGTLDPDVPATEARVVLAPVVRRLSERDRQIIEMRFFAGMTQSQIGEVIGVTQMQVSRLLSRILRDLRSALEQHPAAAA